MEHKKSFTFQSFEHYLGMFHPKFNGAESLLVASVLPFKNVTASSYDGAAKQGFFNAKRFS